MLISALTTAIAIAAVVGVIGYRVFRAGGSVTPAVVPPDGVIMLPKGARIVSATVLARRVAVTIEIGGVTEIRIFDLPALRQIGRLQFATEP
jgi:hypothetical protein